MIKLRLPPRTNNLYFNLPKGGRAKSGEYRAWLTEMGWLIKAQKPERVVGPYHVNIRIPRDMRGDCDGVIKPTLDLLVKMEITHDDKFLQSLFIERADVSEMEIEVRAA